jgi:hypothetical protein
VLNPPHDTRHDTRLPVLTEVDESMAPLEELDDSTKVLEGWRKAGLLWSCSITITNTKGLYLYSCPNTTSSRSRVQHSLPKLIPRRQCPSCTRHQFVSSLYSGHVITYSRMFPFPSTKQPFCRIMACYRPQVPLPNAVRKIFCRMMFLYQTRPTN